MATNDLLSGDTVIEVVRFKGEEILVKEMKFSEWKNLVKQKGCRYVSYQKGFSSYKK